MVMMMGGWENSPFRLIAKLGSYIETLTKYKVA